MQPRKLPLEIKRLASSLFAGSTGFSGPEIYEWFGQFSEDVGEYPWSNAPSRWIMFESCLETFPLDEQIELLLKLIEYQGPMKYGPPPREKVEELRRLVLEFATGVRGEKSVLSQVTWEAVRSEWDKTLRRVVDDPEGAITSSRTVLETVCKHILEHLGVEDASKGDLGKLYKLVAKELRLAPESHSEQVFKQILGGMVSIVTGLASLRNMYGDAHGKSSRRIKPKARHARLAVNAAMTMAEFLIETFEECLENKGEV